MAGSMRLPAHINLTIEHNPHAVNHETVRDYLVRCEGIPLEDLDACEAAGEIWEIQWYPRTPIGFNRVWGYSLARALELANAE